MNHKKTELEAHQGVATEYPGNTMSAFLAAVRQGYDMIELDPNYTLDEKFVILHDQTVNRTGRKIDKSPIEDNKLLSSITLDELQSYEFGSYFDEKFFGEKAPLMTDVLYLSKKTGIKLKIDNKFESFPHEVKEKFLSLFENTDAKIGLTMANPDAMIALSEKFPNLEFHYDGVITEEVLQKLSKKIGKDRLTVWIPYKNERTDWVKVEFANENLAASIKKYAKLGIWLLTSDKEYDEAKALGADIVETDGSLKPHKGE